jgi:hypothetical protein
MAFDGNEGGPIFIEDAAAMTAEYRRLNPNATKCHFFGKNTIQQLLDQEGCKGIRIYYGISPTTGVRELILVAADSSGNDMTNLIMDLSHPCPNSCSTSNALNSDIIPKRG